MEYDNTNSGVLFKNESDNEKAPAYKGKLNVGGTEYQLAAWVRTAKSGNKFMSLKVSEMNPNGSVKPQPKKGDPFDDAAGIVDEIPF